MELCSSLDMVGNSYSYRSVFWIYWSMAHFYRPIPFYHSMSNYLCSKEVKMKEDLHEEGFDLGEMLSFQLKNRCIDTHVILSGSKHSERQKLFGADGDLSPSF